MRSSPSWVVMPTTMMRWQKVAHFQATLKAAGEDSLRRAAGLLARRSVEAVIRLSKEMEHEEPSAGRIAAADKILRSPELRARWRDMDFEPMPMSPKEFTEFVREESQRWRKVVEVSGFKIED